MADRHVKAVTLLPLNSRPPVRPCPAALRSLCGAVVAPNPLTQPNSRSPLHPRRRELDRSYSNLWPKVVPALAAARMLRPAGQDEVLAEQLRERAREAKHRFVP